MARMEILITGSSGLTGSEVEEYFDRHGHRIVGVNHNMRRPFFLACRATPSGTSSGSNASGGTVCSANSTSFRAGVTTTSWPIECRMSDKALLRGGAASKLRLSPLARQEGDLPAFIWVWYCDRMLKSP